MAEDAQDVLYRGLQELQSELERFRDVNAVLDRARAALVEAQEEWRTLTVDQRHTAERLVGATEEAIGATRLVTAKAEALAETLIPLAEAIRTVNFPLRLDRIDLNVSTLGSTLATLHGTVQGRFADLSRELGSVADMTRNGVDTVRGEVRGASDRAGDRFGELETRLEAARKVGIAAIALISVGLIGLAGIAALLLRG